jgi:hypothetical protein
MKNIYRQYSSKKIPASGISFWLHLLNWLRLLVLSLTRTREKLPDKSFYPSLKGRIKLLNIKPIPKSHITHLIKNKAMKPKSILIKLSILLLLFVSGKNAMAQGPYPNTGHHEVCLNATEPYGVPLTAGSSYVWTVTPLAGGNGTITPGATPNLITVNWTTVGTATMQVIETNSSGCVGDPVTITVNINPLPTVTVNSSTICPGTLATITATPGTAGTYSYVWTVPIGVTNPGNVATFTSGIAGTYSVVITNTATGCGSASASGTVTITVLPTATISYTSPFCANNATVQNVTLTGTGAFNGGTYTVAPAGLTIDATTGAITPNTSTPGIYTVTYIVAAGGGCPPVTATAPVTISALLSPTVNCGTSTTSSVTFNWTAVAGATGYTVSYQVNAGAPVNVGAIGNVLTYSVTGLSGGDNATITVTPTGGVGGCFTAANATCIATACTPPTASISYAGPFCANVTAPQPVTLTGTGTFTGGTYSAPAGLTINAATGAITPSTSTPGIYTVTYTIAASGGCQAVIATASVTINPLPAPVVTGPSPVCVSATGATSTYSTPNIAGHTYNWTVVGGTIATGQGTNTITVTWTTAGPGSVSVTETITASGCTGSNTLNVTVNPKPVTSPITHN